MSKQDFLCKLGIHLEEPYMTFRRDGESYTRGEYIGSGTWCNHCLKKLTYEF